MILQENHKEFTIKCFAEYMTHSDVVDAFILEFQHEHSTRLTQNYLVIQQVRAERRQQIDS